MNWHMALAVRQDPRMGGGLMVPFYGVPPAPPPPSTLSGGGVSFLFHRTPPATSPPFNSFVALDEEPKAWAARCPPGVRPTSSRGVLFWVSQECRSARRRLVKVEARINAKG